MGVDDLNDPLGPPDQQLFNVPVDVPVDTTNQEILTVLSEMRDMTRDMMNDTTIQETTSQLLDTAVVFGNLIVGFLIGYIMVKGMVEPWK